MKCHAGVEFPSGKPCPKCNAKLGEVCWPGINADLLEVVGLRKENERLRSAPAQRALPEFEDARVQLVYELLCDNNEPPNPEEHWEGWLARRIVASLMGQAALTSTERCDGADDLEHLDGMLDDRARD